MTKPVSIPFPSLIGGVSQQPDALRFTSQAKAADNVYLSPIDGVIPRHGTDTIATIASTYVGPQVVHAIDRDESERYLVNMGHQSLQVFDLLGREFPVRADATGTAADLTYLDGAASYNNKADLFDWSSFTWQSNLEALNPALTAEQGPFGSGEVYRLQADSSVAGSSDWVNQTTGLTSPQPQVYQCCIKTAGEAVVPGEIDLMFQQLVDSYVTFNPADPLNTTSTGSEVLSHGAEALRDDWYLVWIVYQPTGSIENRNLTIRINETTPANDASCLVWGPVMVDERDTPILEVIPKKLPFKAQSVIDYTFILNTEIPPALQNAVAPGNDADGEALVFIQQIANGTGYTVKITSSAGTEEFTAAVIGQRADGTPYNNFGPASGASSVWIGGTVYQIGDKVSYNGADYVCIEAHSGVVQPEITSGWENQWAVNVDPTDSFARGNVSPEGTAVASALANLINNSAITISITAEAKGPVLYLYGDGVESLDTVEAFTSKENGNYVSVLDGNGIDEITDAPLISKDGFIVKVRGDAENDLDDYWVKFVAKDPSANLSEGVWEETVAPGAQYILNPATMPHTLVRRVDDAVGTATGTGGETYFTFEEADWDDREVGNDTSNPTPSFVETGFRKTISDVFFHENRLGFLADQDVILSENGAYFNFWRSSTAFGVVASDRVDLTAATTAVTRFQSAAAFEGEVLLFADNEQFVLTHTEIFAPDTAELKPVLSYRINSRVRPANLGGTVSFPFKRGDFSGVREVVRLQDGLSFEAPDITVQCPTYLEGEILEMVGSPLEDMMVVRTSGFTNGFYVYKWAGQGQSRVQSAWTRYVFDNAADVRGVAWIDNDLYVVILHGGTSLHIERIQVRPQPIDEGSTFHTRLDRRQRTTDPAVTSALVSGDTEFTFPLAIEAGAVVADAVSGQLVDHTLSAGKVVVTGDVQAEDYWVGYSYDWKLTFGTPYIKTGPEGRQNNRTGRLQLLWGRLEFADSARFTVEVAGPGASREYEYTGKSIGSYVLGTLNDDDGEYRFPILLKNTDAVVSVKSSSHLPARLLSIEWESQFSPRTSRVG
tara:strand:+ start:325 stop:3510 length:3186 start_codon:yes stop_codon:yes gene_type:complete